EPDVGEEFQLQPELSLLSLSTGLMTRGCAIRRRCEARVSAAPHPTRGHDRPIRGMGHVDDQSVVRLVEHEGPDRYMDLEVVTGTSGSLGALAVAPSLRMEDRLVPEGEQRIDFGVGDENHGAAMAAVTAIRPALRHELLAAERHAAVPTVAPQDGDPGFVDE